MPCPAAGRRCRHPRPSCSSTLSLRRRSRPRPRSRLQAAARSTCERPCARAFSFVADGGSVELSSSRRNPRRSQVRYRLSAMKTSLGIWAFGSMVTRFVPGGYQPRVGGRVDGGSACGRAVDGLGDLIDDYEFHYPQELSPENLDEVREALDGHGIYCRRRRAPPRPALRQGRPRLARRRDARGGAAADARRGRLRRRARRALDRLAGDRGLQLPVPDAVRGVVGVVHRRHRRRPPSARGSTRRDALPRAQELRAGDEDPHAQHRHDAARDPQAARAGHRQRQGQHGLAAPDHERREPRRVRGAARRRGAARPPARELRLGHVRRRQHGRRDRVHGDARARGRAAPRRLRRRTASGSASTSTRTPRTRSARCGAPCCSGASSTAVAARIDDAALREAQQAKDAVRAYELVYAALGAREPPAASSSGLDVGTTGVKAIAIAPRRRSVARDAPRRATRSRRRSPGWAEQDPEDWWRAAQARARATRPQPARSASRARCTGSSCSTSDDRVLRPAILWNDQRTAAECAEIERRVGLDRLIELTGNRALTGFTAPKLLWLRTHEPETYARIRHVLLPKDYVRLRLTGERAIDVADASGTLLFDVAHRRWSDEVCARARRSRSSGCRRRTSRPEIAGAGDQAAGALGVGIAAPGPALGRARHVRRRLRRAARVRARAAGARARLLPRRARHLARDGRDALGGRLARAGCATSLGARRTTTLDAEAARWAPGAEGLLFAPYLAGERTPHADPDARGAFTGLSLRHDRGALVARGARGRRVRAARLARAAARARRRRRRSAASRAAARAASSGCGSSRRCSACRSSGPRSRRAPRTAPRCSRASARASSPTPPRRSRAASASARPIEPDPAGQASTTTATRASARSIRPQTLEELR